MLYRLTRINKLIFKVPCNRVKKVLPNLADELQSVFISGRLIQDNVLIAFELLHSMKNKHKGM